MSLSRKHYQAIASELRDERDIPCNGPEAQEVIDRIEDRLCAYFQADNPNFQPDTFRKAAQP